MRLIVFGASGQVGRILVGLAAEARHAVTAVVREGAEFVAPEGVKVVRGDPLDAAFVAGAIPGHDAVASGLGLKRANPANPWSRLVSPADFSSRTARHIVAGMRAAGVKRVCAVSAAGVGESAARMNWLMHVFVKTSNVGVGYRDLAVMEQVYADSGLDWQTPRPTRLTDGPPTGAVAETDAFPLTAAISRADVAAYMLAQLHRPTFVLRTPTITGA
jgi:putative NADH-flavin reductase